MWSIGDIKSKGKAAFKGNYWKSVIASILLGLFAGGTSTAAKSQTDEDTFSSAFLNLTPEEQALAIKVLLGGMVFIFIISILLKIFVFNPLKVGCYRFFRKNVQSTDTDLGAISEGFSSYGHTFCTLFLTEFFLALWTLLLIIPGFIKTYSYRMVPYILKDNPELSATEVITRSRQMMNGNKWRAFVFDLSFIGWALLGLITCGIVLIFWTNPYYNNANAALYDELSKN